MIKRETYMRRIRPFIGSELVKVMTGIRRCGKSVMLELIKTGFVEVHQESTFGDIDINVVKDPELIDEIIVEE